MPKTALKKMTFLRFWREALQNFLYIQPNMHTRVSMVMTCRYVTWNDHTEFEASMSCSRRKWILYFLTLSFAGKAFATI